MGRKSHDEPEEIQISSGGGIGSVPIKTTRQEEILMHWVSDGDLNDLAQSRTGRLDNLLWAMVGAALGALVPAAEVLYKTYSVSPPLPMGRLSLLKVLVFSITAALVALAAFVVYRKGKSGRELLTEIRNRPKF